MLHTLWKGLLDLIYPRPLGCVYCGKEKSLLDHELCAACLAAIEFVRGPVCAKCGKPLDAGAGLCTDCSREVRSFTRVLPVALYRGWLKDAIHAYKFDRQTELAKPFARLMSGRFLQGGFRAEGIVPVPMHRARLKQRRFNHAELLACRFGEFVNLPVWPEVLAKKAEKPLQHKLGREARARNAQAAFVVQAPELIKGKIIILLDDIYTTGFTAQACTAALLQGGAKAVVVSVLAIGTNQSRILQKLTEYNTKTKC